MELEEALTILRRFASWKSGKDVRGFDEIGFKATEITDALCVVQRHFGKPEFETDCTGCRYNCNDIYCLKDVTGACEENKK